MQTSDEIISSLCANAFIPGKQVTSSVGNQQSTLTMEGTYNRPPKILSEGKNTTQR
jgi:hypothetical protein